MSRTLSSTPTIRSLGEISSSFLAKHDGTRRSRSGSIHRTGAPVRRDSLEAGTFEDTFFVVPAKGETDRQIALAAKALDEGRRLRRLERQDTIKLSERERALAALTAGAIRVFQELCTIARVQGGKVYPSYDRLAQLTQLGRQTIARAIPLLEAAGFLVRQRRFTRVEEEGPGPRYKQTSNAYRTLLPKRLLSLLPRWYRPAPMPDDVIQREADRKEEQEAMLSKLNCRELARATLSGSMADAFARLGASVDARECEY